MSADVLRACGGPIQNGRKGIPECHRDLGLWPAFDDSALDGATARRFRKLRDATALYLNFEPLSVVLKVAPVSERRFLRIVERCFEVDREGKILGFRAFVKGLRASSPKRVAECSAVEGGKGGFSGMFRKILVDKPEIEAGLIAKLNGYGLKGMSPNKLMFRSLHLHFKKLCADQGVPPEGYPLNTRECGRRSLRRWIDAVYLPRFASRFLSQEYGPDAGALAAYGLGDGTSDLAAPGAWGMIIDSTIIDVSARYEMPNAQGDWESLELKRFSQLRAIHKGTSANLSSRQVYSTQVSAQDVCLLLWDSLSGPEPIPQTIEGLHAEPGAGYPAVEIPELRFAVPSVVYLDNALAHLADDVQHTIAHLFGAKVILGRPKTPRERAAIESKFSLQARRVEHQLPSSAGSGPKDPVRKRSAVAVTKRIRSDELEQVLSVYVMNENAFTAAGAHNISPLERLRRQIQSGVLKPTYLPVEKRKAYFFCRPIRVHVRVDPKAGRRPYINYLYQRYSSDALCRRFDLKTKVMYVRADYTNLRTIMLFHEDGTEFGPLQALGHWGTFPHDVRIRRLFGRLKRDGQLDMRADDRPLQVLFEHLRQKAPRDKNAALQLTNLISYLRRQNFQLDLDLSQIAIEWHSLEKKTEDISILPVHNPDLRVETDQSAEPPGRPGPSLAPGTPLNRATHDGLKPATKWVLPRRSIR
jgi:putative transposase